MKYNLRYITACASVLMLMASCSDNEPDASRDAASADNTIFAACSRMLTAENIGNDDTDETAPIILNEFMEGSILYFSQMPQGENPNFEDDTEEAKSYLYEYEYRKNESATWESGENFVNKEGRWSFDWERTLSVGPNGNAFKFFAFYYPVGNTIRWNVEQDQTGGDETPYDKSNFLRSDIMGAYHATSSIYTRMRFRLYHLMTYLKVTLYVPVYKGEFSEPEKQNYSGFNAGALKGGYLLNAITDFSIEWAASKSSDTEAPLVQSNQSSQRKNIKMYRHQADEDATINLPVKDYYNGSVDGVIDNMDEVRVYNFSVIFPTQAFNDNFLCFALTTPGGDVKYYYFSGSQLLGADSDSYGLTQGTLQQLYLYLPRKTNQTVLVGAKILPWQNAQTDMTVSKQQND